MPLIQGMTIPLTSRNSDAPGRIGVGPDGGDRESYRVAVASGKGGTGKTTVAVNLALTAAAGGMRVQFLDCDVKEQGRPLCPEPRVLERIPVSLPLPLVDPALCDGCGACVDACGDRALEVEEGRVLVAPERCCGCGACIPLCPLGALKIGSRSVGVVEKGTSIGLSLVQGRLAAGQAPVSALIAGIRDSAGEADLTILDCPSGTSGPTIEAVRNAHLVLFVTEPTPFGLHDLVLATDMAEALGMPFGLVLNRCGEDPAAAFPDLRFQRIPVIMNIPEDASLAGACTGEGSPPEPPHPCRALFSEGLRSILGILRESAALPDR